MHCYFIDKLLFLDAIDNMKKVTKGNTFRKSYN